MRTPALRGPVLEVVRHAAGREDERPRWGVNPAIAQQDAHGPLDHVEDVVLVVGVRARPLRVRLEPPFRDRVPLLGLGAVGQEAARDAAHRIRSPAARREEHALPRHAARMRRAAVLVLEKSSGATGAPCRRSRARGSGGSPRPTGSSERPRARSRPKSRPATSGHQLTGSADRYTPVPRGVWPRLRTNRLGRRVAGAKTACSRTVPGPAERRPNPACHV